MERFAKNLKNKVEELLGDGGDGFEVTLHDIMKKTSTQKNAIRIRKRGNYVAQSFYLEYFYNRFQLGVSLDTLAVEIIDLYEFAANEATEKEAISSC